MEGNSLLTVAEVADTLRIRRTLAYKLLAERQIATIRVGRSVRVPVRCLHEYIDRQLSAAQSR